MRRHLTIANYIYFCMIEIQRNKEGFPISAPCAVPTAYRTYHRRLPNGDKETWEQVCQRTIPALAKLGSLSPEQERQLMDLQQRLYVTTSGRWLWVGGTKWIEDPHNFPGAYNCCSLTPTSWEDFGLSKRLLGMGTGVGFVLEEENISQLPTITRSYEVEVVGTFGTKASEATIIEMNDEAVTILIGDSLDGWVDAYVTFISLFSWDSGSKLVSPSVAKIIVDVSAIRPPGTPIKGFGGVANPIGVAQCFVRTASILNGAKGRKLNTVEAGLIQAEAAVEIVAGNVRRAALIQQYHNSDVLGAAAKDNLWQEMEDGTWRIDPKRDAFRMANHTRVFHQKPSLQQVEEAVTKQYYSGEGAIQWAGEAVLRSNMDLIKDESERLEFLRQYEAGTIKEYIQYLAPHLDDREIDHRAKRYGLNPCGEITMYNNLCNLAQVHLDLIDPQDSETQARAFESAALSVCALLNHKFPYPKLQYSREIDPLVAVTFNGLFDFFINAFGEDWAKWWHEGRPRSEGQRFLLQEQEFLSRWSRTVRNTVLDYCKAHGLRVPNRTTCVQPSGTKSLLTGGCSAFYPPKARYFYRRITMRRFDPIAQACFDYGFVVRPSQSSKDENGVLLSDPLDPRVSEWLIEIPCRVPWADQIPHQYKLGTLEGTPIESQWDLLMQVQTHYTEYNSSVTLEFSKHDIPTLSRLIHQAIAEDQGYVSAALLNRDYECFPHYPFSPMTREKYQEEQARLSQVSKGKDLSDLIHKYLINSSPIQDEAPISACEGTSCDMPGK